MTKITHAPQDVINELGDVDIEFLYIAEILDSLEESEGDYPNTQKWLNYDESNIKDVNDRETAIVNHLMGIERLQPGRELKYYVDLKPANVHFKECYFRNVQGDLVKGVTTVSFPWKCEDGFSKALAEEIVAEFGGEIKEIK